MGLMDGDDHVRKVAGAVDVTTEMHFSLFFYTVHVHMQQLQAMLNELSINRA